MPAMTLATNPSSPFPPVTMTLVPARSCTLFPSLVKFSALQSRAEPPLPG